MTGGGLRVDELEVVRDGFRLGPVSVAVEPGTATALIGPSGAGKTTLLRAVAGFLPIRRGTISFDGHRIESTPPERRQFGWVPPGLGLFERRSVRQNVGYPLWIRGDDDWRVRTEPWLERFGLAAVADRRPYRLSSGERQRVAMARALAAGPKLLLWDEPLGALDVESVAALSAVLREVLEQERLPLLLVTHDPRTAASLAREWVILDRGLCRGSAPPGSWIDRARDRFTARFVGHRNVFGREELEAARDSRWGPVLLERAGDGGVLVPSHAIDWSLTAGSPHATVAAIRPQGDQWDIEIRDGRLSFTVGPVAGSDAPPIGASVRFDIRLDRVRGLEA